MDSPRENIIARTILVTIIPRYEETATAIPRSITRSGFVFRMTSRIREPIVKPKKAAIEIGNSAKNHKPRESDRADEVSPRAKTTMKKMIGTHAKPANQPAAINLGSNPSSVFSGSDAIVATLNFMLALDRAEARGTKSKPFRDSTSLLIRSIQVLRSRFV